MREQDHGLGHALDRTLIQLAEAALEDAHPLKLELPVRNVNRTVGTLLGAEVTRRYGGQGLPEDTIHVTLTGSAGQSLGAFLPRGITLDMIGDANDYVGKGLSGGRIIVRPHPDAVFTAENQVDRGQRDRLRRHRRASCSCAAGSASGSACATPACSRSARASATTRSST